MLQGGGEGLSEKVTLEPQRIKSRGFWTKSLLGNGKSPESGLCLSRLKTSKEVSEVFRGKQTERDQRRDQRVMDEGDMQNTS